MNLFRSNFQNNFLASDPREHENPLCPTIIPHGFGVLVPVCGLGIERGPHFMKKLLYIDISSPQKHTIRISKGKPRLQVKLQKNNPLIDIFVELCVL